MVEYTPHFPTNTIWSGWLQLQVQWDDQMNEITQEADQQITTFNNDETIHYIFVTGSQTPGLLFQ